MLRAADLYSFVKRGILPLGQPRQKVTVVILQEEEGHRLTVGDRKPRKIFRLEILHREAEIALLLGEPVQHYGELLPGDGVIGTKRAVAVSSL